MEKRKKSAVCGKTILYGKNKKRVAFMEKRKKIQTIETYRS
jgi:hypothetical protein